MRQRALNACTAEEYSSVDWISTTFIPRTTAEDSSAHDVKNTPQMIGVSATGWTTQILPHWQICSCPQFSHKRHCKHLYSLTNLIGTTSTSTEASPLAKLRYYNFIVDYKGTDFVLYSGLLFLAHDMGLEAIETELIEHDWENGRFIFKCIVRGARGTFTGWGDATVSNTNKMIRPHALRMAETRAKARALRDYTNISLCSKEELA